MACVSYVCFIFLSLFLFCIYLFTYFVDGARPPPFTVAIMHNSINLFTFKVNLGVPISAVTYFYCILTFSNGTNMDISSFDGIFKTEQLPFNTVIDLEFYAVNKYGKSDSYYDQITVGGNLFLKIINVYLLLLKFIVILDCSYEQCNGRGICNPTGGCISCNGTYDVASNCSLCSNPLFDHLSTCLICVPNYFNYPNCTCIIFHFILCFNFNYLFCFVYRLYSRDVQWRILWIKRYMYL